MPQIARITDCWLWPERAGVRGGTPAATTPANDATDSGQSSKLGKLFGIGKK